MESRRVKNLLREPLLHFLLLGRVDSRGFVNWIRKNNQTVAKWWGHCYPGTTRDQSQARLGAGYDRESALHSQAV